MTTPADLPLKAGGKIGKYTLIEVLAQSGGGVVVSAKDEDGARYAIKTLRAWQGDSFEQRARYLREARAANDIDHPAIVRVLDSGTLDDGRPFLVMEELAGRTLEQAIKSDGRLSPARAFHVLRTVAEALTKAHALGIIHRDIKPSNVFLEQRASDPHGERPRLLDFGLAHELVGDGDEETAKLTQSGILVGTPAYMAPEQWWGLPAAPAMDQYALGVTLFEALTGKPPFSVVSVRSLMEQHLHTEPPSAIEAGAPIDAAADGFLKRLLAKDPNERFASMAEALIAFDEAFSAFAGEPYTSDLRIAPAVTDEPPKAISASGAVAARSALSGTTADSSYSNEGPAKRFAQRPWLLHAGALSTGIAALASVGYAGDARHDVVLFIRIGAAGHIGVVLFFLIAAIYVPFAAKRSPGRFPRGALVLSILPALAGTIGVYTNYQAVLRSVSEVGSIDAFRVLCMGTYEANAPRFLGFALASILCASLVSVPVSAAYSAGRLARATAPPPKGEQRVRTALIATLAALSVAAALLGAPSGAWVAAVATLSLGAIALFPDVDGRTELSRSLACLCSVGLGLAAGIARVEARRAVLWSEPATRAVRVAEIFDARAEMYATILIGGSACAFAVIVIALSLSRAESQKSLPRPSRDAWALGVVVVAAIAFDLTIRSGSLERRAELREQLAPQFATVAHLDPPQGDALDPAKFAVHRSTGLQIGRDAIAIDGRGIAKLGALDTETGRYHATSALHQALAQAAVEGEGSAVDLSVIADESVTYRTIGKLLAIARSGGARRVDLVYRRGPKPAIAIDAPPEAAYVVPSDFVAISVELHDEGLTFAEGDRWSDIAARVLSAAASGDPIRLRVPLDG